MTRYVDEGLVEIDNNAERALRNIALVRKNYLAQVLERNADHPINRSDELLPWNLDLSEGNSS